MTEQEEARGLFLRALNKLAYDVRVDLATKSICIEMWDNARSFTYGGYHSRYFAHLLNNMTSKWPESVKPGCAYPVPAPADMNTGDPVNDALAAFCVHMQSHTMWLGEYGDNRKRLLAYMVEQAKLL